MKRLSPEFSCDFFLGKAVSLIRTAAFSENEEDLLFYKGTALDPVMKDIIDLNYGGEYETISDDRILTGLSIEEHVEANKDVIFD